ncbi:TPR-like protein [Lentinula edodes]|uniref:TPR-like protein n=1 Tax=Lentinula edodes TaxID=5353 RepID=A0A1Q3E751_LENED|nr:TPR-like protein [Lentinula edodes]
MLFEDVPTDDSHGLFDFNGSEGSISPSDSGSDEDSSDDQDDDIEIPNDMVVVENEIEGDFKYSPTERSFDDLRAASGVGKRRKGKPRGSGPPLSQQVRSLIGDGNQAFVDNDLPEAVRIMQEVIRIEPRAASAWSVLAQCYEDMQQKDRALQLRIMAAHLRHDAEEWDRLAHESRNLGFYQQALYCYRKIYSLDPSNVDALWDRATLAKEIGELRIARQSFLSILKRFPHDLTVLSEIRPILVELGDLTTCTALFQNAFDDYQQRFPSGSGPIAGTPGTESTSAVVLGGGFTMLNLLVLADLYNTLGEYDNAVRVIKSGIRWLQGRGDQRYWNLLEDDREYDPEGFNRVASVAANTIHDSASSLAANVPTAGPSNAAGGIVGTVEIQSGYFPLDVNARHRLAVARIKMGEINEGVVHANIVLQEDVLDYAVLFIEIADAYYERGMWAEAKPVYEILGTDASTSSVYILLQTASCLRMLDELKDAAEIYDSSR